MRRRGSEFSGFPVVSITEKKSVCELMILKGVL